MLQSFVELPATVQTNIAALVFALIALVFNFVIARVPFLAFLRTYQEEWSLALSVVVINFIQNALPTGYEAASITGVQFLLALVFLFVPYLAIRKQFVKRGIL